MFDINAPEFVVLVVIAIVLFGPEKLPDFVRKAARVLRYLRSIASNAQQQLGKELGPGFEDLDIRDLNPKSFIQKHLLEDVEPIVADVKSEFSDLGTTSKAAVNDVAAALESVKDKSAGGPAPASPPAAPPGAAPRSGTPYDPDAT